MALEETSTFHSYEPNIGHRLAHDPISSILGPRPIGWISTRADDGTLNLAPYSFFNVFNYKPPIVAFSSVGWKDTIRNVQATGEFVVNLATRELAQAVNTTSTEAPVMTNEFDLAGLTPLPSMCVAPPRIAQSPASLECRALEVRQLHDLKGAKLDTWMALGEVVMVHIDETFLSEGTYDTASARPILRGGGPADYFEIGPASLFTMHRPK